MSPYRDLRLVRFDEEPDEREQFTRPPGRDWFLTIFWACMSAACIGFIAGVVFAIVELVK